MCRNVDPVHAVLHGLADPPDAAKVARVQTDGESLLRVLDQGDGLGLSYEAEQRGHGPEDLLPGQAHRGGQSGQEHRL